MSYVLHAKHGRLLAPGLELFNPPVRVATWNDLWLLARGSLAIIQRSNRKGFWVVLYTTYVPKNAKEWGQKFPTFDAALMAARLTHGI